MIEPKFPNLLSRSEAQWLSKAMISLGPEVTADPKFQVAFLCQSNFAYPAAPKLELEHLSEIQLFLAKATGIPNPQSLKVSAHLENAIESWYKFVQLIKGRPLKVGAFAPCPAELIDFCNKNNVELILLSQDPDQFHETFPKAKIDAFYFANPNPITGFYYPDDLYERIALAIHDNQDTHIIFDESSGLFCFHNIAPGSLRYANSAWIRKERVSLLISLYPTRSPLGPQLVCWNQAQPTQSVSPALNLLPDFETIKKCTEIFVAFQNKQGAMVAEFGRRMLAMQIGVRSLADHIRPLVFDYKKVKLEIWPDAGLSMLLDLSPILHERQISTEDLLLDLARKTGVLLAPGEIYGAPHCARLLYGSHPRGLDDLGLRIFNGLQGPKP